VSGARTSYAVLALGSAAFIAVGSLVPFHFQPRPWGEATDAFVRAMAQRPKTLSKSDLAANVMLGLPLGFALLGMLCAGRALPRVRVALYALALLPMCAAFSAAVEFAQLYAPGRTCSGLDVLAQTVGAAAGMLAWLALGPWFTDQVRRAATGSAPASRLLVAYVVLLGFIQALPLDLNSSPADAYRKLYGRAEAGDTAVKPVPFGEFRTLSGDEVDRRIATLVQLAGLYLPVGLLASRVPGRFWSRGNFPWVLLAGLGLALFLELGQVMVKSRTCNATDVLVGGSAAFAGWLVGHGFRHRLNNGQTILLGALWGVALLWVSWQPLRQGSPVAFDWVPGMPLQGHPLWALEAMLTKLVLFGLAGAIVAARVGVARPHAFAIPVVLGLAASALFEVGQTRFVGHTPGITDVLLGGLGAFCGAWVTRRVCS
jgi:VanZ family protein